VSFTIPNEADAGNANQAEPDKVDVDILVAALGGTGVVDGCAVAAQGSPDQTVAVAAGTVRIGDKEITVAAGNVSLSAAHGSNPRFDLIAVDNAGTKSAVDGTAAAEPVFPAIPANSVILAAIYRAANDNVVASGEIVDKRAVVPSTRYRRSFLMMGA